MRSPLVLLLVLAAGCGQPDASGRICGPSVVPCPDGYFCDPDMRCRMHAPPPDLAVETDLAMCSADSCKGGPLPVCDPASHQCVACLADGDCPSGKLCAGKACVPGCSQAHGCPDGGGACQNGMCHACSGNGDCGGQTPLCDLASGLCVACVGDGDCPNGEYCDGASHTCKPGCGTDAACQQGVDGGAQSRRCCNHACVDVASDGMNCGACGTACGKGATCCAGACATLASDLANCGACGNACAGGNATWTCTQSACAIAQCNQNFADCNNTPGDGCEANLLSDLKNCGACAKPCQSANATAACMGGQCMFGMCNPGFADCDNNPGDGCEVNLQSDVNNCGGCGQGCGIPNATSICLAGQCAIGACTPGLSNCDGDLGNGCEKDTSSDPANCGGCGNVCPNANNATVGCAMSMCAISGCNAGFADCDKQFGDGCEAATTSDPANCGGCGVACAKGANVATTSCANSACAINTCNAGFGDCDKVFGNGCEVNTNTDKNNCGKCGTVCPINQGCQNGTCSAGVTFSATYTNGADGQAQCTNWNNYRASLVGNYTGVTIKGTFDNVGITCNNSGAGEPNKIATALRTGAALTQACGGRTWAVGTCGSGIELTATGPVCQCQTPGYTHRPCIGQLNSNWGGVNTTTCTAPTQTITITFF